MLQEQVLGNKPQLGAVILLTIVCDKDVRVPGFQPGTSCRGVHAPDTHRHARAPLVGVGLPDRGNAGRGKACVPCKELHQLLAGDAIPCKCRPSCLCVIGPCFAALCFPSSQGAEERQGPRNQGKPQKVCQDAKPETSKKLPPGQEWDQGSDKRSNSNN